MRVEVPVADATLVGERWTGAGPAIVLLHAGVCDRRGWHGLAGRLNALGWDVCAYDRRGFGEVPPAVRPFRHVDDLLAVLGAVSPDAPAWLMGSSMGGGLALDAALEAPERVAGLVLIAPAISGDPQPDDDAVDAETSGLASAIDAAWTAGQLDACNRLEVRLWLDGPSAPEGRVSGPARALALEMNRVVLENERNSEPEADGASHVEAANRLDEIAVPAIVACGELDLPSKLRRCAELADALRHGRYRSLPGRAHLPYLEAPEEVAALLESHPAQMGDDRRRIP
jgi:pimeloyl-ACP methyl ester carboxylesterase